MKAITLASALFFALSLAGCAKNPAASEEPAAAELPCTCGQPEAMLHGCAYPLCTSGEGNPENEDCVCGPLSYEGGDQ